MNLVLPTFRRAANRRALCGGSRQFLGGSENGCQRSRDADRKRSGDGFGTFRRVSERGKPEAVSQAHVRAYGTEYQGRIVFHVFLKPRSYFVSNSVWTRFFASRFALKRQTKQYAKSKRPPITETARTIWTPFCRTNLGVHASNQFAPYIGPTYFCLRREESAQTPGFGQLLRTAAWKPTCTHHSRTPKTYALPGCVPEFCLADSVGGILLESIFDAE